jgi:hypothetical protein
VAERLNKKPPKIRNIYRIPDCAKFRPLGFLPESSEKASAEIAFLKGVTGNGFPAAGTQVAERRDKGAQGRQGVENTVHAKPPGHLKSPR